MKQRRSIVAFTLFMAAMLAWAPGSVAAGHGLVVGSEHTTQSDFQAGTLSHIDAPGGYIEYSPPATYSDGFEDGSEANWSDPGTNSYDVTTTNPNSGSYSFEDKDTGRGGIWYNASNVSRGNHISIAVDKQSTSSDVSVLAFLAQNQSEGIDANEPGYYVLLDGGSGGQMTLRHVAEDGTINDLDSTSIAWDGGYNTVNITLYDSNNTIDVTVTNSTTTLGSVSASHDGYQEGYFGVGLEETPSFFDDVAFEKTDEPNQYLSQNHSVSNAEEAWVDFPTLRDGEATVEWQGYNTSTNSWDVVNSTTYTTTGNRTLDISGTGYEKWRVNVTFVETGSDPAMRIDDEGILFTSRAPTGSNLKPADGTKLSSSSVDFEVDVNDSDFATAQGDSVDASLWIDGSKVGTKTITSNGTVTITETLSEGGDHDYHWKLNDSYGESTTTATNTVSVPANISIRNETSPGQYVTSATANITFYYGDEITRKNTSDGNVSLSGLPVDEPIIMYIQADGYHSRTITISSIYEQDNAFLLNDTLSSYQLVFDIQDSTGTYPRSDTALKIQRDIKINGSTEWRTVSGDIFGGQGVVTNLQADERYRLVIQNLETNERSVLGSFTPVQSERITLEPEPAQVDINGTSDTALGYDASRNEAGDKIIVEYADPSDSTDTLKFRIRERGNTSNVLLANQTYTNLGNISYSEPLNASEQNKSWVVDFYFDQGDGFEHARVTVGQGPRDIIPVELDDVYRVSVGVLVLLLTALLFSQLNHGVGALTTAVSGGILWYLGFLDQITTGPAVVLAFAVAALVHYKQGGAPA